MGSNSGEGDLEGSCRVEPNNRPRPMAQKTFLL